MVSRTGRPKTLTRRDRKERASVTLDQREDASSISTKARISTVRRTLLKRGHGPHRGMRAVQTDSPSDDTIQAVLKLSTPPMRRARGWIILRGRLYAGPTCHFAACRLILVLASRESSPPARCEPCDPFPFNLLTTIVSLEAIFLTLFVLVSQNRMSREADKRAQLDLQVNLLAEKEATMILRNASRDFAEAGHDRTDYRP